MLPYMDAAYRFARWLARSPEDADDVVQDAILRAYWGCDALRESDVKAWLLMIVRNCHSTSLKQQQQRRAYVPLMSRLARARSMLKQRWLLQARGEPHAVL